MRPENAAPALEVMSRFAIAPEWLLYLPPTMAPVPASTVDGLLEHPADAFEAYRREGVDRVVCEEKHMGSRAVVVVAKDADAARRHFGERGTRTGVVYTRTGREFFPGELGEALVERVTAAVAGAGLFDELDADWIALDAELLPWSAKAQGLLRSQYAQVGAAARAAMPPALAALDAAAARGVDVAEVRDRFGVRASNAAAFTAAYRQYCWPTDGLNGVELAVFQVLANNGASHEERPHEWHMAISDRLVDADSKLFRPTRRVFADLASEQECADAAQWWQDMTAAGGEGMVVKPADNLNRDRTKPAQPGIKVRGAEYLRIIYGPDYLDPATLATLKSRSVGRKRSLASREYALGVEGLERAAAGEPTWRVHECAFAVLALESEPVDPRL